MIENGPTSADNILYNYLSLSERLKKEDCICVLVWRDYKLHKIRPLIEEVSNTCMDVVKPKKNQSIYLWSSNKYLENAGIKDLMPVKRYEKIIQ